MHTHTVQSCFDEFYKLSWMLQSLSFIIVTNMHNYALFTSWFQIQLFPLCMPFYFLPATTAFAVLQNPTIQCPFVLGGGARCHLYHQQVAASQQNNMWRLREQQTGTGGHCIFMLLNPNIYTESNIF